MWMMETIWRPRKSPPSRELSRSLRRWALRFLTSASTRMEGGPGLRTLLDAAELGRRSFDVGLVWRLSLLGFS